MHKEVKFKGANNETLLLGTNYQLQVVISVCTPLCTHDILPSVI